jgi:hypothetical protein
LLRSARRTRAEDREKRPRTKGHSGGRKTIAKKAAEYRLKSAKLDWQLFLGTLFMKAIGFRAEPSALNWAVVQGCKNEPILLGYGKEEPSATFDEPAALKWFRDKVQNIVQSYLPDIAAIRFPETFQPHVKHVLLGQRCRVEGVVIEVVCSSGIKILTGPLASIAKNLGSKTAKHYLASDELRGLDWSKHKPNGREAILVAASALP